MSEMFDFIRGLPDQIEIAYIRGKKVKIDAQIKYYVVGGMGGSAIGGDILSSYLFLQSAIPVNVIRNYYAPTYIDEKTLFVCSSYSGNTEETISLYDYAKSKKSQIVVITSGGQLEEMAINDNIPVIKIPKGLPPRCAVGYSLFSQIGLAESVNILTEQEKIVNSVVVSLKEYLSKIDENTLPLQIAKELKGKLPIIYSDELIGAVAKRWVSQINENAKQLAHYGLFPEMNHNEIMAWQYPSKILDNAKVIFLRHSKEHERVQKRFEILNKMLTEKGQDVMEVHYDAHNRLEELMGLLYIGDFVSFYLAKENGVDPISIENIEYLKKELNGEEENGY